MQKGQKVTSINNKKKQDYDQRFLKAYRREIEVFKKKYPDSIIYTDDYRTEIEAILKRFAKNFKENDNNSAVTANAISVTLRNILTGFPLSAIDDEKDGFGKGDTVNSRYQYLFKKDGDVYCKNAILFLDMHEKIVFTEENEIEGFSSTQKVKFPFSPKSLNVLVGRQYLDEGKEKDPLLTYIKDSEGKEFAYYIVNANSLIEHKFSDSFDNPKIEKILSEGFGKGE